jgi:hypothetical protein
MKALTFFLISFFCLNLFACSRNDDSLPNPTTETNPTDTTNTSTAMKLKVTINNTIFTATLQDNATAKALKELLPLTLNMTEFNNNEKYAELPNSLPTNATNPGTIQNGDLMLYGNNVLVLFYKTFPTSYSYTKIGKIDSPEALQNALGIGDATVKFELE